MKTFLSKSIKAVFLGLLFGAISVYAAGITSPSGTPSTMNAALPINVSANNQLKQGGIGMSSLLVGPGAVLPSPTNASILGSLRIGTGTVPTGTGNLQINDRASIGSGITWSGIPANSLSVAGFTSSGTGMWTPANITAGLNGLVNPPTAAGTSGAIIANKFCFAGTNGACTTTWGSGTGSATFPAGLLGQTLYYATAGTTVTPTSTFSISGTSATINGTGAATGTADAWARFTVNNGGLLVNKGGTDALILNNTAGGANYLSVVSNVPQLNFWSSDGVGHNSDIVTRNVRATALNTAGGDYVCSDAGGNLYNCPVTLPIQTPAPTGQTCGLYNYQATTGDGSHFGCPNGSALVQISSNGQTGTCRYYDPLVTTGSTAVPNTDPAKYCYSAGAFYLNVALGAYSSATNCYNRDETITATPFNAIGAVTYHWTYGADAISPDYELGTVHTVYGINTNAIHFLFPYYESQAPANYVSKVWDFTVVATDSVGRTVTETYHLSTTRRPAQVNGSVCPQ